MIALGDRRAVRRIRALHYVDQVLNAFAPGETNAYVSIKPQLGFGVTESSKASIEWSELRVRGTVALNTIPALRAFQGYSLHVLQELHPTGFGPVYQDIFSQTMSGQGADIWDFYNVNNIPTKYVSLYREVLPLLVGSATAPTTGSETFTLDKKIDLKGAVTNLVDNGAGGTDVTFGDLYVYINSHGSPPISMTLRATFTVL